MNFQVIIFGFKITPSKIIPYHIFIENLFKSDVLINLWKIFKNDILIIKFFSKNFIFKRFDISNFEKLYEYIKKNGIFIYNLHF